MQVVGVSFHVGSGCRDASRYELALRDAREIFDMAEKEYGFKMNILDIGGGFPGETHSTWNPTEIDPDDEEEEEEDEGKEENEGLEENAKKEDEDEGDHFMYFTEIATKVAPMLDEMFPPESGVRLIAEPGRYFVAAAATLVASVVACRHNGLDENFEPVAIDDEEAAEIVNDMTREDEQNVVRQRSQSICEENAGDILESVADELADYSKLFARQHLAQQEADVYNDNLDLYREGYETSIDLLGPPTEEQMETAVHTVEGMDINLIKIVTDDNEAASNTGLLTLAAAGEAAMNGLVLKSVVDSTKDKDDFAYYINDGVYSAFNNLMYDHAVIRPRQLKNAMLERAGQVGVKTRCDGIIQFEKPSDKTDLESSEDAQPLYASTVFGPTCDSIDVIARSVLLPKLQIGDYLYFQNMGAYTMAASSCFNGFNPSERFYVCSVPLQYLEKIITGYEPFEALKEEEAIHSDEEKKECAN